MSSKKSKKKPKAKAHGVNRSTRDMLMLSGNPIWRALSKEPVTEITKISIGLAGRKSLYALTNDEGLFEHCKELMVTAYAGIYLAEQGYGADVMNDFIDGLAAIKECRSRARKGLAYTLDSEEARKVDVLLDMHEQQLELADKAEVSDAIVESYGRAGAVLE
jgi:hypothetical protein